MATRLRLIAVSVTDVYTVESWGELEAVIHGKPVTIVIVDPTADRQLCIDEASQLIEKHPSLYFIVYASVSAPSVSAVLQLSRLGVKEFLTQGVDDSPRILREKLQRLECTALARVNFRTLLPPLDNLPAAVVRALENMFQNPQEYSSAHDLARDAAIPLSRLYRSFEIALLRSPKDFLVAAKVWHGYSYLRRANHSVRDVASELGYNRTRVFVSHVTLVFGLHPSALRSKLSVPEARERVASWLQKRNNATVSEA